MEIKWRTKRQLQRGQLLAEARLLLLDILNTLISTDLTETLDTLEFKQSLDCSKALKLNSYRELISMGRPLPVSKSAIRILFEVLYKLSIGGKPVTFTIFLTPYTPYIDTPPNIEAKYIFNTYILPELQRLLTTKHNGKLLVSEDDDEVRLEVQWEHQTTRSIRHQAVLTAQHRTIRRQACSLASKMMQILLIADSSVSRVQIWDYNYDRTAMVTMKVYRQRYETTLDTRLPSNGEFVEILHRILFYHQVEKMPLRFSIDLYCYAKSNQIRGMEITAQLEKFVIPQLRRLFAERDPENEVEVRHLSTEWIELNITWPGDTKFAHAAHRGLEKKGMCQNLFENTLEFLPQFSQDIRKHRQLQ